MVYFDPPEPDPWYGLPSDCNPSSTYSESKVRVGYSRISKQQPLTKKFAKNLLADVGSIFKKLAPAVPPQKIKK